MESSSPRRRSSRPPVASGESSSRRILIMAADLESATGMVSVVEDPQAVRRPPPLIVRMMPWSRGCCGCVKSDKRAPLGQKRLLNACAAISPAAMSKAPVLKDGGRCYAQCQCVRLCRIYRAFPSLPFVWFFWLYSVLSHLGPMSDPDLQIWRRQWPTPWVKTPAISGRRRPRCILSTEHCQQANAPAAGCQTLIKLLSCERSQSARYGTCPIPRTKRAR
jgi:hypothetical protein